MHGQGAAAGLQQVAKSPHPYHGSCQGAATGAQPSPLAGSGASEMPRSVSCAALAAAGASVSRHCPCAPAAFPCFQHDLRVAGHLAHMTQTAAPCGAPPR